MNAFFTAVATYGCGLVGETPPILVKLPFIYPFIPDVRFGLPGLRYPARSTLRTVLFTVGYPFALPLPYHRFGCYTVV